MSRKRTVQHATATVSIETRPARAESDHQQLRVWLVALALCILTLSVYAQTVHFDFINFDDDKYVSDNPHVRNGITVEGIEYAFTSFKDFYWHPVTWLSHMLDCQLFGVDAGWHHVTNVVVHTANVILVLLLLLRLTGAFWRSTLVAALFAIHPLHVESVAWIAERKDLLGCLFWLLTTWMYVGYVRGPKSSQRKRYVLAVLMFLLAIMSKPTVVTLPFALLLLDYWPLERLTLASAVKLVREKIPFFALSFVSSVITYLGQKQGGAVQDLNKLAPGVHIRNVFVSYVLYLRDLIWPRSLGVLYPLPHSIPVSSFLLSIVILMALTVLVLRQWRKAPYLAVGWLWYLGVLTPMSGIVQVGEASRADRFTYIPSIGLFVLIVWGAWEAAQRYSVKRSVLACISALLLLAFAARAWNQVGYWRDGETLYTHTITITGSNPLLENNLGATLEQKGEWREGEKYLRASIREDPYDVDTYDNLATSLVEQGKFAEALEVATQAVGLQPRNAVAIYNRAIALDQLNQVPAAIQGFQEALGYGLPPNFVAPAHEYLGQMWLVSGQNQAALKELETALAMQPDLLEARINHALALAALGRRQEAAAELDQLRTADPKDGRILQAWQYVHSLLNHTN
jgi:protein O-mannosyl-transferase